MKQEFNIHNYRGIEETYIEKLKYINHCIREAEKISVRQTINELKFIRLQIREYCSLKVYLIPQNIPTGEKRITVPDSAILNYVNEKINYYSELEKININVINKPDNKTFPALPDCFIDKNYFPELLKDPKISDHFTKMGNGSFKWNSEKARLGALAVRLFNKGKLIPEIKWTNQDLAKVFCPFFNVTFNEKHEKQFEADRIDKYSFDFI
jgi:hypothetical protein